MNEMTLNEALSLVMGGGLDNRPQLGFSSEVNDRLRLDGLYAKQAVNAASKSTAGIEMVSRKESLLNSINRSTTNTKKLFWLRAASNDFVKTYAPHSACKVGCNHCCHIPIVIAETEALSIGKAIGIKPENLKLEPGSAKLSELTKKFEGYESPCPFLKDGACSIYEHRPLACRNHINMDVDDLLCRLNGSGQSVPVPMANNRHLSFGYALSFEKGKWADIRDWFPKQN